jgi:hypothetical protein
MKVQRFKTTLVKAGTKTMLPIPFDPDDVWGTKPRHHVTGSINGCKIRGVLVSEGATCSLSVPPSWRRDNGLDAGDLVEAELAPEGPQFADLAPDIAAALDASPQARAFFEGLATFYRKGYLRWIDGARRRPETRASRIREMVGLLEAGEKQR